MPHLARLIPVVLAALAGCAEIPSLDPGLDWNEGEPVAITRFEGVHLPAAYGGGAEPERTVVETQAEWEAVWRRFQGSSHPAPAVDFAREVVLVAGMGGRPTGGFSIRVDRAAVAGGHVNVRVVERSPGRRCGTTQAVTSPVDMVKMTRTPLPVRFHTESSVHEC